MTRYIVYKKQGAGWHEVDDFKTFNNALEVYDKILRNGSEAQIIKEERTVLKSSD